MSVFRVVRQSDTTIKIEEVASGEVFPFVVMRVGPDGDRTLTYAPEATGRQPFQKPLGDLYDGARAFAEEAMLKADAIDRTNP